MNVKLIFLIIFFLLTTGCDQFGIGDDPTSTPTAVAETDNLNSELN